MVRIALRNKYPFRFEVPILLAISLLLFLLSLRLPLLQVEKQLLWKHWRNDYSVLGGIHGLFDDREYILAIVLFFFTIVFPLLKFAVLAMIWALRLTEARRSVWLQWLDVFGKWSMMDVLAMAILITLVKLGTLVNVRPQSGVYVFAIAIFLFAVTAYDIEHLARGKEHARN